MHRIFGDYPRGRTAVGLLIVRLVFGAGIMIHGWYKIHSPGGPMGWMGPTAPVPGFLQALATAAEFSGGIGIILGLLTPLAALGLMCTMLTALCMVHFPHGDPFIANGAGRSFEPAAGYLAVALLMLIAGPGCYSLDAVFLQPLFGRSNAASRSNSSRRDASD